MSSLVLVTPEPPGANCPLGGERIESGLDTNGNGSLDPGEITNTEYVCNGLLQQSAVLSGTVDPTTVFNSPSDCYFYPNNLVSGIWHRWSHQIIAGSYGSNGYWSSFAGVGGYPSSPNNDTGTKYARMVHVPDTQTVIHAGTDQFASPASTIYVGRIGLAGNLGGFAPAVFSDAFAGNCNLISSTPTEFLCYDGTSVRHYATSEFSATLTWVKSVTLSAQPTNACGSYCFGGTFAWDGAYYYFADTGSSSTNLLYAVYDSNGTLVNKYTANGAGAISSVYFDWSVGAYATHDGWGARTGTNNYTWSGGTTSDDSQCYARSAAHVLP